MSKSVQYVHPGLYPALGPLVVTSKHPIRFEVTNEKLTAYVTERGTERVLVVDDAFNRPSRRWYDAQHRLHRPEDDGPAIEEPTVGIKTYFKHGKRHRLGGPAFYTATREQLFFIDGKELPREAHARVAAGAKMPKVPKLDLDLLRSRAAQLAAEARQAGRVGCHVVPADELQELDTASSPRAWKRYEAPRLAWPHWEVTFNCAPLDDTLRCYFLLDLDGTIDQAWLSVE